MCVCACVCVCVSCTLFQCSGCPLCVFTASPPLATTQTDGWSPTKTRPPGPVTPIKKGPLRVDQFGETSYKKVREKQYVSLHTCRLNKFATTPVYSLSLFASLKIQLFAP